MTARTFFRTLLTTTLIAALPLIADRPNAQPDSGDLTQERRGGSDRGTSKGKGAVAHVGAGTTSGSTTGNSGPQNEAVKQQIELPPLPSEALCEAYKDTAAYQSCLWVSLGQTKEAPK
jgi:hypothetical protein